MSAVSAVRVAVRVPAACVQVLFLLLLAIAAAPSAIAEPRSSFPHDYATLPDAAVFLAWTTGHPEPSPDHTSLWRTDGTAAGTFELRVCSASCNPRPRIAATAGELVFFAAYDETFEWQMWRTDGSQAGTVRLTDFQGFSLPPEPHDVLWAEGLGRFFFVVEELAGWSLWSSDGTAVGTTRVVALPASVPSAPFGLVEHDGAVYFFVSPIEPNPGSYQLWRSGGTGASTSLVATIDGGLTPWDTGPATSLPQGLIFAVHDQGFGGKKLWSTDGTPAGTIPLASFPGALDFTPKLARIGDLAWFWGVDDVVGRQLWVSDGSEAGTRRLTSIGFGGSFHTGAWDPLPWQDGVVFGAQVAPAGFELWASDGTPEGTGRLFDFCAGPCGSFPVLTATTDEHLYFGHAGHHWQSDGTLAGTRKLADVAFSTPSLTVPPVIVVGDLLFLRGSASQNDFEELWSVERVTGEVRQVTDLGVSPLRFGHDWQVGVLGDRLLFAADDGSHGLEPWISDGTPAGTRMIEDVAPGGDGFASCFPSDRVLCLEGDRFRVEVAWDDQHNGGSGFGHALPASGSDLSGYFWFFTPDNVELIVKVLDGTSINGFHWTFYGALTDVGYELTVTDTVTGEHRTYLNPPGEICGRGDTTSLPGAAATAGNRAAAAARQRALSLPATDGGRAVDGVFAAAHPEEACVADGATLCLLDGRFRVRVEWQDQHNGGSGTGGALPFTDVSGFFWFFTPDNVELVVKALDARSLDGNFWFFYGALSDVGYTITVEDLVDGHRSRQYVNPPGEICGEGDTSAFSG